MYFNSITFELLQQHHEILDSIFDSVRIIDPLSKKVSLLKEQVLSSAESACYEYWERKEVCGNCIAMRALMSEEAFFKIEHSFKKVYIMVAIPIVYNDGKTRILELIKDVTGSIVINGSPDSSGNKLLSLLAELNRLQVTDSLTGLHNRRFIDERLPVDLMSQLAVEKPISVVLVDIDRFKNVNDTYGHVAGDHVLMEFARLLADSVKEDAGWVARYGGEEFVICLKNMDLRKVEQAVEEIRKKIEIYEFKHGEEPIKITASFGISTLRKPRQVPVEAIIEDADKNMYKAKEGGRNRIVSGEI